MSFQFFAIHSRLFLSLMMLMPFVVNAQTSFQKIDARSKSVPDSLITYQSVTKYLVQDLQKDTEKVRAIYVWITHNIRYDYSYLNRIFKSTNDIIKEKAGVCMHYSQLFGKMCKEANIRAYTIDGYTKDFWGAYSSVGHAWNAVEINDSIYFIDATWGAGYVKEDSTFIFKFDSSYFMVRPSQFIKNHIPTNPHFQFIPNPINQYTFLMQPSLLDERTAPDSQYQREQFHMMQKGLYEEELANDSLKKLSKKNRYTEENIRTTNENIRMYKSNIFNAMFRNAEIKYNVSLGCYDCYFSCKKRGFRETSFGQEPALSDQEIRTLHQYTLHSLTEAKRQFDNIEFVNPNDKMMLDTFKKNLLQKIEIMQSEEIFINKYLNRIAILRPFMLLNFYNGKM